MSNIFKQVVTELGIKHYTSSAYHPESQGALERFHQTLKNMMRKYCTENKKDWDEGIHLLLFASRESVQDSLGYSPFELIFGHTVRGPLKLLKEQFMSEDKPRDLLTYVCTFKDRLQNACEIANNNLKQTQKDMKSRYDKNTKVRVFKPGDKVLIFLPIQGRSLNARYQGPYEIESCHSPLNYLVKTPDRRKSKQLCHVNMIKMYHSRVPDGTDKQVHNVSLVDNTSDNDNTLDGTEIGHDVRLKNTEILAKIEEKMRHLDTMQKDELSQLITEYSDLFPDVHTKTTAVYHDVEIGDALPIKQHPYRVNPLKLDAMREEINYMLENDIIEPSNSDFSSPSMLVSKPDGTYRFVTNFKAVNAITNCDSYPIPRIEDCIDKIGQTKYVSKFDLLKGFWQVPLTERAKRVSAFATPDGLYQYRVMPFGMRNSPATFQRLINRVISGLTGCEAYIDDLVLHIDSWNSLMQVHRALFDRLRAARLTVNLAKSEFCQATVQYLGYVVGQGQIKPVTAKIDAILRYPAPRDKKSLMRFLGTIGYYRRFCVNLSSLINPLTNLLGKNVKFIWSKECSEAFERVKRLLMTSPVLITAN